MENSTIRKYRSPSMFLPLGVLITSIGSGMYTLAVGKLFYDVTGETNAFAVLLVVETVIVLSAQALASHAVDKGCAKRAAFMADIIRGISVIICGIVAYNGYISSIFFATVILNLLKPFYRTATYAFGPLMFKEQKLIKYNARISMCMQTGMLIGAGIAGIIMTIFSPYIAIIINGISYLLSATCIVLAKIENQQIFIKQKKEMKEYVRGISPYNIFFEWKELVLNLLRIKSLLVLVCLGSIDFVMISFINIMYAPLLAVAKTPKWWISVWDSMFAVGAIIGAIIFGKRKQIKLPYKLISLSLFLEGIVILGVISNNVYFISCVMFLLGITNAISVSCFSYSMQTIAKVGFHGRISGVKQLFISIAITVIIPIVSKLLDIKINLACIFIMGICIVASVLVFYWFRKLEIDDVKKVA